MAEEAVTIIDVKLSPSGTAAVDQYTQGMQKAGAATDALNQKVETSPRVVSAATREMQNYLARLDPVFFATQRLGSEQGKLQTSLRGLEQDLARGAISVQQYGDRHALLTGRINEVTVAAQKLAAGNLSAKDAMAAMSTAAERSGAIAELQVTALRTTGNETANNTRLFGLNANGLMELKAAGVNAFQALAAGMSPLRVATMEGAQVVGAFAQGGLGLTTILKAIVSPIGLAVAGIATLGGGLLLLSGHAANSESALRKFGVALGPLNSPAAAAGLQTAARALRDMGVASADANTALAALARNPVINRQAAGQLVQIGANVGARLGVDPAAGLKALEQAISGGVDATVKFGLSLRAMDADEAANILTMQRHGAPIAALNRAIEDIRKTLDGAREQSLDPSTKAIESIGNAWDHMLDKLSKTTTIQAAKAAIIGLFEGTAAALANGPAPGSIPNTKPSPYGYVRPYTGAPPPGVQIIGPNGEAVSGPGNFNIPGGAVSAAATGSANVAQLNSEFGTRLDAWLGALSDSDRALVRITSAYRDAAQQGSLFAGSDQSGRMVAAPGGSAHGYGIAADVKGMSDAARQSLALYGLHTPMAYEPWHVEPIETLNADQASAAQRRLSFQSFSQQYGSGVFGNLRQPTAAPPSFVEADQNKLKDAKTIYDKLTDSIKDELAVQRLRGSDSEALAAKQRVLNEQLDHGVDPVLAMTRAEAAAQGVRDKTAIQLGKAASDQRTEADLAVKTAEAYGKDEVAGLQAAALAEARRAQLVEPSINLEQKRAEILRTNAASAISAAAQQNAAILPQIAAEQRLADASIKGAGALHEQTVVNEAIARTQDVVNKALATGDKNLIAIANSEQTEAIAKARRLDLLKQEVDLNNQANINNNAVAVVQLETQLQGQTAEYISTQVALLKEKQRIQGNGVDLSNATAQNDLRSVAALGQANTALAEAQRNQQRFDDGIRQAANTIDNTLTTSIDNAFSGQKVTDWGATIKSTLASIVSQLASGLFIKPLLGSILSGLGFNSAATQFGSLSSITNLFGGGAAGSSSGGGGLLGNVSGIGDLFGGTKSFLSDTFGGGLGGIFGHTPTAADFASGVGPVLEAPGSLFSGGIGSVLGGAGIGAFGGGILNSLIGGNTVFGGIGSSIGSLAGSFLGPLGSIGGGLLGGLVGGLFGNNHPKDNVSAINIDNTGALSGAVSGSAQNNQVVQQVGSAIAGVIGAIRQAIPGATLPGGQAVINSGDYSGVRAFYNGQQFNFASAQDAITQISHFIADNLTGISDTLKTVLHQVTDPAQLQSAVAFATAYDDLKKASDSAFTSVEKDTQTVGPFAAAMAQLNSTFGTLKDQATQFGLALEPINAALAEATSRLQGDFLKSLDQALNTSSGKDYLNQLSALAVSRDQQYSEANAIGLPQGSVSNQLNTITAQNASAILTQLTAAQLTDVASTMATVRPEFADMAKQLLAAGKAADQLAASTAASNAILAAGIQIRQYLNSLDTGQDFTSPESRLVAAQKQYSAQLANAGRGDVPSLQGITGTAQTFVQAVSAYYASSPQGAAIVAQIKSDLAGLPGVPDAITGMTNAIVTATNNAGNQVASTVSATASDVISASLSSSAAIVATSAKAASDIVANSIAGSNDVVNASLQGAASISGSTAVSAAAISATIATTTGASAGSIIAATGNSAEALLAGNQANSATLVANDNANASALISANGQAAALFVSSNDNAALALAGRADLNTGLSIRATAAIGDNIIGAILVGANSSVAAIFASGANQIGATFAAANSIVAASAIPYLQVSNTALIESATVMSQMLGELKTIREFINFLTEGSIQYFEFSAEKQGATADAVQEVADNARRAAFAA